MNAVKFLLGEKRKVWLEISVVDNADFLIRNATFELEKYDKHLDQGECTIDGHTIIAFVNPPERGQFDLIFTFEIGGEIVKEKVVVTVE